MEAGGHFPQFGKAVGIASPEGHEIAPFDQRQGLLVGYGRVAAIDRFEQSAAGGGENVLLDRTPGPKGMGGNSDAAGHVDQRQQRLGPKTEGETGKWSKNEKIALGCGVFHAHNHAQTVSLHAFVKIMNSVHGIMVCDADTVQASTSGMFEEGSEWQVAAWGAVSVHMDIEEHAYF